MQNQEETRAEGMWVEPEVPGVGGGWGALSLYSIFTGSPMDLHSVEQELS